MLRSMTGFGSATTENDAYKVTVELKAVNQRFLELNFHMGRQLNAWENDLRQLIKKVAARGKVDIYINFSVKEVAKVNVKVNRGLLLAYQQAFNEMSDLLHVPRTDTVSRFTEIPDIIQVEENQDLEPMKPLLVEAMQLALANFDNMRQTEGTNIEQDFLQRITTLENLRDKVATVAPEIVKNYQAQLKAHISEALGAAVVDEARLIQEVAIFADKVNYTEEVVRLASHIKQFREIVTTASEPIGRKLDFLTQELNRETNTIGSKANNTEVANLVVAMKSEIEKLREQVQNIE